MMIVSSWSHFLQTEDESRAPKKPAPLEVASAFIIADVSHLNGGKKPTKSETIPHDCLPLHHRFRAGLTIKHARLGDKGELPSEQAVGSLIQGMRHKGVGGDWGREKNVVGNPCISKTHSEHRTTKPSRVGLQGLAFEEETHSKVNRETPYGIFLLVVIF